MKKHVAQSWEALAAAIENTVDEAVATFDRLPESVISKRPDTQPILDFCHISSRLIQARSAEISPTRITGEVRQTKVAR